MDKKIHLSFFAFVFFIFTDAQVHVSNDSYVFVNEDFIYIKEELNLESNATIYLRNKSQLLQGTSGASFNSGNGSLSVFQEGTTNNFQYNYWCSPVGLPSSVAGNSNFGISRLHRPTGILTSDLATILPVSNLNGISNPLSISQRWIYTFTTSNTYSQWNFIGSNNTILPGLGFTMKGTSGTDNLIVHSDENIQNNPGSRQRYDFRGKPNDGTISVPVSIGNFTLVGNPYPSSIDLNSYLLDPDNAALINGQAYFWEQVVVNTHVLNQYQGGYGIYNPVTGIYTPASFTTFDGAGNQGVPIGSGNIFQRRFSPIGQGFMIFGTANGNVSMKNSYRVYVKEDVVNQSEFARTDSNTNSNLDVYNTSSEYFPVIPNVAGLDYTQLRKSTAPYIRIHAMYNNSGVRPTTIAFLDSATDGFDYGADGRSPSSEAAEFYYILSDMPHEYVATAVNFDINKRIPVGFRCNTSTNFKIQVKDIVNFDVNQEVYLHDILTDLYYDIRNNIFEITLPAGNIKNRFEITFKDNNVLSNDDIVNQNSNFEVFQDNKNSVISISNPYSLNLEEIRVYDVLGKLLISKTNIGNNKNITIDNSFFSEGVYVVRLKIKNDNSIEVKKIIKTN